MKISPVVTETIETRHTSFIVNFRVLYNITFIIGDSGTGKSAVFSFVKELAVKDNRIRCFNYLDKNIGYKSIIKKSKGKLFIIDNADLLLDDKTRQYIALDTMNQYVIIGRNPTGLLLGQDEIFELESRTVGDITEFSLKQAFG